MTLTSTTAKKPAEQVIKDIRRATRRHFSAEDKIRIVLDGLRGEDSIAELCRKEGIAQSLYYTWSKEFMEAGKRLDGQQADELERFEVGADAAIGQAKVFGQALLSRKAVIVLPSVAEQHGERHLVAGAEFGGFEEEVGDLGEALGGGRIGALEDDVAVLEDVADVTALGVIHASIIAPGHEHKRLVPYCVPRASVFADVSPCEPPSSGVSIFCRPAMR